jgi:TRAP-type C4-dicarboxylate transport system permease small subunit
MTPTSNGGAAGARPRTPDAADTPWLLAKASILSNVLAYAFGYVMLALSVIVTAETVARKLLGFSLQGVDELGGYALAVGSSLAFTTALVERGHIRIDLLHLSFPRTLQALLNWLSVLLIAVFALLLLKVGADVIGETIEFGSTAPTPWATPLIWPQAIWYAALGLFAVVAIVLAAHASYAFATGRWTELARLYGPKLAEEEVKEELEDLSRR